MLIQNDSDADLHRTILGARISVFFVSTAEGRTIVGCASGVADVAAALQEVVRAAPRGVAVEFVGPQTLKVI